MHHLTRSAPIKIRLVAGTVAACLFGSCGAAPEADGRPDDGVTPAQNGGATGSGGAKVPKGPGQGGNGAVLAGGGGGTAADPRMDARPEAAGGSPSANGGSRGADASALGDPSGNPPADAGRPIDATNVAARPYPLTHAPHITDYVFDETKVRSYYITATPAVLADLEKNGLKELYVEGTLKVDDEDVGKIGFRYKGGFQISDCYKTGVNTCKRMSWKLDFAEYVPTQRFHGLKKLNLHSVVADQSYVRERLSYQLFRSMGIYAPRSVHSKLYINGVYKGVYATTEEIDGRFTDYWWGKGLGDGNLYKETWPVHTDAAYYVKGQQTNEKAPTIIPPTKILKFAQALTATGANMPKIIDEAMGMDYMMRMMAVDVGINHFDGPRTFYCGGEIGMCAEGHNFFFYEAGEKLVFLAWDLDHTLDANPIHDTIPGLRWNMVPADCKKNYLVYGSWVGPPGCDKMYRGLAGAGAAKFQAAMKIFLDGPFNVPRMIADIDRWAAQISDGVLMDPTGPGFVLWQTRIATLKTNLPMIRTKSEMRRDGVIP